jgi:ribonuclease P protein component
MVYNFSNQNIKKDERIRRFLEFKKIFKYGKRIEDKRFVIYFLKNDENISRFSIVVGRRIGKAVIRNRIKRIIREIYRKNKRVFGKKMDWIFIAKGQWERIEYNYIESLLIDFINDSKKSKFLFKKERY